MSATSTVREQSIRQGIGLDPARPATSTDRADRLALEASDPVFLPIDLPKGPTGWPDSWQGRIRRAVAYSFRAGWSYSDRAEAESRLMADGYLRLAESIGERPTDGPRAAARRAVAWHLADDGSVVGWQAPGRRESIRPRRDDSDHSLSAYIGRAANLARAERRRRDGTWDLAELGENIADYDGPTDMLAELDERTQEQNAARLDRLPYLAPSDLAEQRADDLADRLKCPAIRPLAYAAARSTTKDARLIDGQWAEIGLSHDGYRKAAGRGAKLLRDECDGEPASLVRYLYRTEPRDGHISSRLEDGEPVPVYLTAPALQWTVEDRSRPAHKRHGSRMAVAPREPRAERPATREQAIATLSRYVEPSAPSELVAAEPVAAYADAARTLSSLPRR